MGAAIAAVGLAASWLGPWTYTKTAWLVDAAVDCQQYYDKSLKAAKDSEQSWADGTVRTSLAMRSVAWLLLYRECKGR
jgi:hypothetical protein